MCPNSISNLEDVLNEYGGTEESRQLPKDPISPYTAHTHSISTMETVVPNTRMKGQSVE